MQNRYLSMALAAIVISAPTIVPAHNFAHGQEDVQKKSPQKKPGKAPQTPQPSTPPPQQPGKQAPKGAPGMMFGGETEPKPYDEVVTKDAKTQKGLFLVHQIKDKVLWEIPTKYLGRDLLWYSELAGTPAGSVGFTTIGSSTGDRVVRFERHDNVVWVRQMNYSVRTTKDSGLEKGVAIASISPIVATFPIQAFGADHSVVIDMTNLFKTDAEPFSEKGALGGGMVNSEASVILSVHDFPKNIETETQITLVGGGGAPASGRFASLFGGGSSGPKTAYFHHSVILLPKTPMQGRLADSRVGFFSSPFTLYGTPDEEAKSEAYIDRFKLVKKDPSAAVSDVVHPITFYIGREVPDKWRPYLKQAVMNWQPVFEAAGFRNAIVCKDAPSEKEDPSWSPEDVRFSVIRWSPSPVENAMGPHVVDPRSGQTISGHVIVWHNVLKLIQTWYFAQASASDPEARSLPLPDDLIGRCLTYVVTHEVGHTLGLEHNFKASSEYPTEKLRDKQFTEKYGDEASIMDYGRFNYVAQPGDGADLIPKIGPYDYFAIKYGYQPAGGDSPDAEKPMLDQYLAQQVSDPMVRFGNSDSTDPGMESEDLGSDPILSSTYGLQNIDRISKTLLTGAVHYGDDYTLLDTAYRALLSQRTLELFHVAKLVGGYYETDYHGGRGGDVYAPTTPAKQREAVKFLCDKGLNFPPSLMNPAVLNKIQSGGELDLVGGIQRTLISTLMSESRVKRMFDTEATGGSQSYTVEELLSDVQSSVWSELHAARPEISIYRRNLQNIYLQAMDGRLNGDSASESDFRGLARMSLMRLKGVLKAKVKVASDDETRAHLLDCLNTVQKILDGKPLPAPAAAFDLSALLGGFNLDPCGDGDVPLIQSIEK